MSELPPFVTIGPPPPELELDDDNNNDRYGWPGRYGRRSALSDVQASKAFPEPVEVGPPEELSTAKVALGALRTGKINSRGPTRRNDLVFYVRLRVQRGKIRLFANVTFQSDRRTRSQRDLGPKHL